MRQKPRMKATYNGEWCRLSDSNRRPIAYKAIALPTELKRQQGKNST